MGPRPRVVVVGGGFGGLAAVRTLAGAPVDVTLVDRKNHHLFQPLLYQVAAAGLSPAEIAYPIRRILRRQQNAGVLLAEARRSTRRRGSCGSRTERFPMTGCTYDRSARLILGYGRERPSFLPASTYGRR